MKKPPLGVSAVEQVRQLYSPSASDMHFVRDMSFGRDMRFARWGFKANIISLRLSGAISLLRSENITPSEHEAYHLNRICGHKCSACQEKRIENVKSLYPFPVRRAILLYRRHPFRFFFCLLDIM